MELRELRGIITVLNTPFASDGAFAPAPLERNIEIAIGAGVAGFLVPAMASEVFTLTAPEREHVVETTLAAVAGRVPVIVGVSGRSAEEREAATKHAVRAEAPGVLVALAGSREEVIEDLHRVLDAGATSVILQDWDPNGFGLPLETVVSLADELPELEGIKIEVAAAGAKYSAVLEATAGRLLVCGGWAVSQLIEALDRGVHAFMPTALHSIYCEIYRRYLAGRREDAQELFRRLLPILAFSNQHLDISIYFFKRLLWKNGVYPTPAVRAPRLPFDRLHQETADELIELATKLEREISDRRTST